MTTPRVQVRIEGPITQGGASLARDLESAFFHHWLDLLRRAVPPALAQAVPKQTGLLARSAYIIRRGNLIEFGYRDPAARYWHLAGRGSWPERHDQIILEAARVTAPIALQRAIRDVLG